MSERLKQEIMDSLKTTQPTPPQEDKIINENKPKTSIDEERSEIKFQNNVEPSATFKNFYFQISSTVTPITWKSNSWNSPSLE